MKVKDLLERGIYPFMDADDGSGSGGSEGESLASEGTGSEGEGTGSEGEKNDSLATEGAEEGTEEGEGESPTGAPEEYEAFTLPEGFELDEKVNADFVEVVRELNLTQDQSQKIVDLYAGMVEQNKAEADEMVNGWREEAANDPEIGGEKFQENLGVARTAVKQFGDNTFRDMLNTTGVGNHPAMLKFLHRVGKELQEGTADTGQGDSGTGNSKTLAEKLYSS